MGSGTIQGSGLKSSPLARAVDHRGWGGASSYAHLVKALMEKAGLTSEFLLEKLREGLDATKLYNIGGQAVEHPDHHARYKF